VEFPLAAEREVSRSHIATLSLDNHLPAPDSSSTHFRMDFGHFRIRWDVHTEFVTWTFSRTLSGENFGESEPPTALERLPQGWLGKFPGQNLASTHVSTTVSTDQQAETQLRSARMKTLDIVSVVDTLYRTIIPTGGQCTHNA
jgi:uncharacterized membrane-anchored protein